MSCRTLKRSSTCKQPKQSACPKKNLGVLNVQLAVCQEESEEESEEQCSQSEAESEDCLQPSPSPPRQCPPPRPACKTTTQGGSDSSYQSKSSSKPEACCKPGCSKRMPCLACTKKGCIGQNPGREARGRDRKCQKTGSMTTSKFQIRSKSEAAPRESNCGGRGGGCKRIKETCCSGDSKKECHPKKSKPANKKKVQCEPPPSSCDEADVEVEVCRQPVERNAKSPCRELKTCPCDDCKNVKFNEKCETIPGPYSSCDNSCDEESFAMKAKRKQKSKKPGPSRCPPCSPTRKTEFRPRSKSCSPNTNRDESPPAPKKPEKNCDCIVCCLGQSSASNFTGFDEQIANGMQLKLPQTFPAYSGSSDWPPPTAPCNCGSPNCSTTFQFSTSRF